MKNVIVMLASIGLTAGCAGMNVSAPENNKMADNALIPRDVLFGNPDRARLTISHDGKHISFLAPVDGVLNVWVAPTNDVSAAKPVTHDTKRGIRQYQWAFNNDYIIY